MNKSERKVYRVLPNDDGWSLKVDGSERASGNFDTQSEAIERGVELAKNHGHSQLIIQGKNGQIHDERTYGDDPFPPRG